MTPPFKAIPQFRPIVKELSYDKHGSLGIIHKVMEPDILGIKFKYVFPISNHKSLEIEHAYKVILNKGFIVTDYFLYELVEELMKYTFIELKLDGRPLFRIDERIRAAFASNIN